MHQAPASQVLSGWIVIGGDAGLAETVEQVRDNPTAWNRYIRVAGVDEDGAPVLVHDCHLRPTGATVVVDYP